MFKKTLRSIIILLLIISLAYTGRALFLQQQKQRKVDAEIQALKNQAAEIEQKNQNLSQSLDFLQSTAYKEHIARESLNMKAEGEIAVSFVPGADGDKAVGSQVKISVPNPVKWWYYFFRLGS